MDTDSNQVRLGAVGIVALSLFLALFARLWFLQGIERQDFEAASVSNRLRVIQTEGPRGRILDRNGKVIVDNRTSIVVALDREPLREKLSGLDERKAKDLEKMHKRLEPDFQRIASALNSFNIPISADDVWAKYADKRYSPQEPVPVAEDVGPEVEQYLMERAAEFPGVTVERRTVRSYPYGPLAAHMIGYVGEINDAELLAHGASIPGSDKSPETTTTVAGQDPKPYELGDSIGKTGVERSHESSLRGVPGERTLEVNAKGELLDVVSDTPPVAGDDVWLTIDIDLQAHAEQLLGQKIEDLRKRARYENPPTNAPQGSVVVTNPVTGEVLAMASYPTYDPRMLVNGISTEVWNQLQDPSSGLPLNNWTMQGTYAPGSTFKPVTALAGLRTGFLRPGNDSYVDTGTFKLQNCKGEKCEFRNSGGVHHGSVDLSRALTVSSDVYFYRIGEGLWLNRGVNGETPIQDTAGELGMGAPTGIDLPGEAKGRLPTPESRRKDHDANPGAFPNAQWYTGDNVITAIGQGDVLLTPLQLVDLYGTLANGGAVMRPHVVYRTSRAIDPTKAPGAQGNYNVVSTVAPEEVRRIEITPEQYIQIFDGLLGVTQNSSGTAASAWRANPTAWPMAGKTGTAQVRNKADTSLFAGWGPAVAGQPPAYAVAAVIPEAGFGSDVAAPLAFSVLAPASSGTLAKACPVSGPEADACHRENDTAALFRAAAGVAQNQGTGDPGSVGRQKVGD